MHHLIHNRCRYQCHLLSRSVKSVTGSRLDQILDRSLVDIALCRTLNEILQRPVLSADLPLLDDLINNRAAE